MYHKSIPVGQNQMIFGLLTNAEKSSVFFKPSLSASILRQTDVYNIL